MKKRGEDDGGSVEEGVVEGEGGRQRRSKMREEEEDIWAIFEKLVSAWWCLCQFYWCHNLVGATLVGANILSSWRWHFSYVGYTFLPIYPIKDIIVGHTIHSKRKDTRGSIESSSGIKATLKHIYKRRIQFPHQTGYKPSPLHF